MFTSLSLYGGVQALTSLLYNTDGVVVFITESEACFLVQIYFVLCIGNFCDVSKLNFCSCSGVCKSLQVLCKIEILLMLQARFNSMIFFT